CSRWLSRIARRARATGRWICAANRRRTPRTAVAPAISEPAPAREPSARLTPHVAPSRRWCATRPRPLLGGLPAAPPLRRRIVAEENGRRMAPVDGQLSLRGSGKGSRTPIRHHVEALRSLEQRLDRRRANVVLTGAGRRDTELGLPVY